MGTSTSNKAAGKNAPLIPSWSDAEPHLPLPQPPPVPRFRDFRIALGRFVRNGEEHNLIRALSEFAGTATGGASVGFRRFGASLNACKNLFEALLCLRREESTQEMFGSDLSEVIGKNIDYAIQQLVNSLPVNGDKEKVRASMIVALFETFANSFEFAVSNLTDEKFSDLIKKIITECIFGEIVMNSGQAFQKGDLDQCVKAENALHHMISTSVEKKVDSFLSDSIGNLNSKHFENIFRNSIIEVWLEWEGR